jgi:type III secretory pathway component EscV
VWLALISPGPTSVTPIDSAATSVIGYIGGFGILGYLVLALVFRWLVPGRTAEKDRANARADLEQQNTQLLERCEHAETQRDEALQFTQVNLVPLLVNFNATMTALIPLLQELVRSQEGGSGDVRRRR